MKTARLIPPAVAGLFLTTIVLLGAVRQSSAALGAVPQRESPAAQTYSYLEQAASPTALVRYVATTGVDSGDCTGPANPCRTVQYAVDVAEEGDEVRVAGGVYTDTNTYTGLVQVVFITKTIDIQGGYTLSNWIVSDPGENQTILDAQGLGRVAYITGTISPTITGLQFTGGDATGLGGFYQWMGNYDAGGGIYIHSAAATISNSHIYSNTSPDFGGGMYVGNSPAVLQRNHVHHNQADSMGGGYFLYNSQALIQENSFTRNNAMSHATGGGLATYQSNDNLISNTFAGNSGSGGGGAYLWQSDGVLVANNFISNTTEGDGAGLFLYQSPASLANNTFRGNVSGEDGGGINMDYSDAVLIDNIFEENQAARGSGLYMLDSYSSLEENRITDNTASSGWAIVLDGSNAILTNNIIVGNHSSGWNGGGIFVDRVQSGRFNHNSIADNSGGDGAGILLTVNNFIALTNTIIASQSVGILAYPNNTVLMEGTLWGSGAWANEQDWTGGGTVLTGTVNVWGDPGFIDPENGDYHIGPTSAAVDAGVDAGIYTDIDGEPRPSGAGFDIGADEIQQGTRYVATTGVDSGNCTDPANPCRTVQYAVDVAEAGDEVRVAAGVYTDTVYYYQTTQTVYISKTIDLQGGYTLTNWTSSEPELNPTILAAPNSQHWVVGINGGISVTVAGFHITGGVKGGILITQATAMIRDNQIYENSGEALQILDSTTTIHENHFHDNNAYAISTHFGSHTIIDSNTIENNRSSIYAIDYFNEVIIASNVISGNREGIFLNGAYGLITGNLIISNTSAEDGGGIRLIDIPIAPVVIENNIIRGNSSEGYGGGIAAIICVPTIRNNYISGNFARSGGGLALRHTPYGPAEINGNTILSNSSQEEGGGVFLEGDNTWFPPGEENQLINNIIADNQAGERGSGVMIWPYTTFSLTHNTITSNQGGDGSGLHLDGRDYLSKIFIKDNIIVSQTVGITVGVETTATLDGTLWGSGAWANGQDWAGSGIILTGTVNVWGDPGFIDPANGDYHISLASAAVDAGVDAGVSTDIDGEPRPFGTGFDIGADEIQQGTRYVATTGVDSGDCTDPANPCRTVQYAVDVAEPGDEVRVAGGTYADTNTFGGLVQIVYLTKTLSIQGGYTLTNWTVPDPDTNRTTLDPQGSGNVVYITGGVTPTLSGFRIIHGQPHGVEISNASPVMQDNLISDNTDSGVYLGSWPSGTSNAQIEGNLIQNNGQGMEVYFSTAAVYSNTFENNGLAAEGGGLFLLSSQVELLGNQFTGNQANSSGGGFYARESAISVTNNTFVSNTSDSNGGGIYLLLDDTSLYSNTIQGNSANDGGGIYLYESNASLEGNLFYSNTATIGGGLYAHLGDTSLISSTFISNYADYNGGGAYIDTGSAVISNNQVISNTAGAGGGISVWDSQVTISNNTIHSNFAYDFGGGIDAIGSDATLNTNAVTGNSTDGSGGGIQIISGDISLNANLIQGNSAFDSGGIKASSPNMTFTNNIIADNFGTTNGSGVLVYGGLVALDHNTFARNSGDVGAGVLGSADQVTMTNNIIVSQTYGVYFGGNLSMEGTLWGSGEWANGTDWYIYSGTFSTGTVNVWGDPGFIDPQNGDYHITPASAAVDAGVDVGVTTDIDGEPRPMGAGFDIGADELQALLQLSQGASADPVASGDLLTYTLRLTNTGAVDLHATVTDVLPAQVIPAGVLTWTAFLPAQGDPWTQAVTVLVDPGYAGPLTNTLQAASLEGAAGVAISRILAVQPIGGIMVSNSGPTRLGEATWLTATLETGSQVTFTWDFGDGSTGSGQVVTHTYPAIGIYTATVTASNLVSQGSAQTSVDVEELLSELSVTSDSPTALGHPTIFTASLGAGSHPVFSWDFGDGSTGIGEVVTHTHPATGIYTATVSASNPVSSLAAQTIVIVEEAIAGLSASASSPTILGEATAFTATVATGSHVSYLWDFGDGTVGAGGVVTHSYPAVGIYTATVTAGNLVSSINAQTTVIVEEAIAGLSAASSSPTILGEATAFTATVTGGSNIVFAWDFGDGSTGVGAAATHTYAATGVFTATVTASNPVGEARAATQVGVISALRRVFLPVMLNLAGRQSTPYEPKPQLPAAIRD